MEKILVATTNAGKVREYQRLLAGLEFEFVGLDQVGLGDMDVEENGTTFEENALIKARAYSKASGLKTLADDSGLEVDALQGRPGVRSARYAKDAGFHGPPTEKDKANYQQALRDLLEVQTTRQQSVDTKARFRCAIALVAGETENSFSGSCEGRLIFEPRGSNGFGYDPIFVAEGFSQTIAEMDSHEKDRISHRGKAVQALRGFLSSSNS